MPKRVFVATTSFACAIGNDRFVINEGTTVREGHPLLKGREKLFVLVDDDVDFDVVEQMTAPPGERRRGPGRPKLPRDEDGNIVRAEDDG